MTALLPPLRSCAYDNLPEVPTLNAVALYDDLSSVLLVTSAFTGLRDCLRSALRINTYAWSFQQLEKPDVRAHATRIAATADIILVAGHCGVRMTGHVSQWLESCLEAREGDSPVLTALDEGLSRLVDSTQAENRLCNSLRQVATRWGVGFLHDDEFERNINPEFALELVASHRRAKPAFQGTPATSARAVPRHYGIND